MNTSALKVELEERTCDGGCGRKFRVMPNSPIRRASKNCDNMCKGIELSAQQLYETRKNFAFPGGLPPDLRKGASQKPPKKATEEVACEVVEDTRPIVARSVGTKLEATEKERLWRECVSLAKQHIASVNKARHEIILLAVKCCDIQWGGGAHWNDHAGVYTIRQFAMEIGINPKTLQNWVRIYRVTTEALPPGEYTEEDYKYAAEAYKNMQKGRRRDKAALLREYLRQKEGSQVVFRFNMMRRWARTQVNYLNRTNLKPLREADKEEVVKYLEQMITRIKETPCSI